jgi:hypothetical protein
MRERSGPGGLTRKVESLPSNHVVRPVDAIPVDRAMLDRVMAGWACSRPPTRRSVDPPIFKNEGEAPETENC